MSYQFQVKYPCSMLANKLFITLKHFRWLFYQPSGVRPLHPASIKHAKICNTDDHAILFMIIGYLGKGDLLLFRPFVP